MIGAVASANKLFIPGNGLVWYTFPRLSKYKNSSRFRENYSNINSNPNPSVDANGDVVQASNTGNKIDFGNPSSTNFSTGFTIGIWVRRNGAQSVDCGLLGKFQEGGGNNGWMLWSDGAMRVQLYVNAGVRTNNTTVLPDNQWCLVIGVWNGTNTSIYVNDVVRGTGSYAIAPSSSAHTIKYGSYQLNRLFKGTLSMAFAYNRALSTAELTAIYNSTRVIYGV